MVQTGKFVISIDLELFWGLHHRAEIDRWRQGLLVARQAVPRVLELFEGYQVRATWAALGLLFCRDRDEILENLPRRLPAYHAPKISPYAHIAEIGDDEEEDPWHFGASLLEQICTARGQEIATRTFANFRCLQQGQHGPDFEADLRAALGIARRWGLLVRSLVFPGGQVRSSYLDICRRMGISAYRGNPPIWPYGPRLADERDHLRRWARRADAVLPITGTRCVLDEEPKKGTPVNVPATRRLRNLGALAGLAAPVQRQRIFAELDCAARKGGLFHLHWFDRDFAGRPKPMIELLQAILERFDGWRRLGRMESYTMHDVVMGDSDAAHPLMGSNRVVG